MQTEGLCTHRNLDEGAVVEDWVGVQRHHWNTPVLNEDWSLYRCHCRIMRILVGSWYIYIIVFVAVVIKIVIII